MSSLRPPTPQEMEKTLGTPVGFDISEAASKIRRNLLLSSAIALALVFGDISAGPNVPIFGVTLTNVTPVKVMVGLGVILIYNLVHYLWYCYELHAEWSIRITGTKLSFLTGSAWGAQGADYPSDPKQSTLYSWWRQESKSMESHAEVLQEVRLKLDELELRTDELAGRDMTSPGSVTQSITSLRSSLDQVARTLVETQNIVKSTRIPVSLGRFERRFQLLLTAQNVRVLLVEVYFPIVVAIVAAIFLIAFIVSSH